MPWLTPDLPGTTATVCRRFRLPAKLDFISAFSGAVLDLASAFNWEQYGDLTPEVTAEIFQRIVLDGIYEDDFCMIGVIVPYACTTPPTHTLPCDGAIYLRTDYPLLYDAIDPVFIVDADHFSTPDLVARFPLGATLSPTGAYPVGTTGGEDEHTLTVGEMPSHSHTDTGHVHGEGIAAPNVTTIGPGAPEPTAVPAVGFTASASANLTDTGGGGAHNNMPPFVAVKYAIFYD